MIGHNRAGFLNILFSYLADNANDVYCAVDGLTTMIFNYNAKRSNEDISKKFFIY